MPDHPLFPAEQLLTEVIRLFPFFLEDPVDAAQCRGNAGVYLFDPSGRVFGHVFGADKALARQFLGLAHRKALQVWSTGYATGRFEELVYAGRLDECQFGVNRPDFIGWEGGVPFFLPDGSLLAAGLSGFRGMNDVAILKRAALSVPGLKVRED